MSPGLAYSCFELLDLVSRRTLAAQDVIAAFQNIGVMPAEKVFSKCQSLRWLQVSALGAMTLEPSGRRILSLQVHEQRLRQALLDHVDIEAPVWLQNSLYGRRKVVEFADLGIVQLLDEAGLLESTEDYAVAFWDALAARARGQKDDVLLGIGRDGERLSIQFEERRTGVTPRWIALDNNQDGYDLLSVLSESDLSPLLIEVKASKLGQRGAMYITRREWDVATAARHHAFHLWDLSASPRLSVVSCEQLSGHIPNDSGQGKWTTAVVPFLLDA